MCDSALVEVGDGGEHLARRVGEAGIGPYEGDLGGSGVEGFSGRGLFGEACWAAWALVWLWLVGGLKLHEGLSAFDGRGSLTHAVRQHVSAKVYLGEERPL